MNIGDLMRVISTENLFLVLDVTEYGYMLQLIGSDMPVLFRDKDVDPMLNTGRWVKIK